MYKQLTAKAPRYGFSFLFFFFSIRKEKKHPCQFDWYTKNRNGQAFVWILFFVTCRRVTETKSSTAEMQSQSLVPPLLSTFFL